MSRSRLPIDIQFLLESLTGEPISNSAEYEDNLKNPNYDDNEGESGNTPDIYGNHNDGWVSPYHNNTLLDESPDGVSYKKDGTDRYLNWSDDDALAFITTGKISLIGKTKHMTILEALVNDYREGKLDLPENIYFRNLHKLGVEISNEDALREDLFGPVSGPFRDTAIENNGWVGIRRMKGALVGRLWIKREVISFWSKQEEVVERWDFIEKMFSDWTSTLGKLNDYNVDFLRSYSDTELIPAKKVSSTRQKSTGSTTAEIIAKILDKVSDMSSLSDEQVRKIQDKIHLLDPQVKADVMKLIHPDLPNKAGKIAAALKMSTAEFNNLMHVDESTLNEDPDRVETPRGNGKPLNLHWLNIDAYAFMAGDLVSIIGNKKKHANMFWALEESCKQPDKMIEFFEKADIEVSSEEELKDELFKKVGPFAKIASGKTGNVREMKDILEGRIWLNSKVISFWNTKETVIEHWNYIETMFQFFTSIFGNLNEYRVDFIERKPQLEPLASAGKINSVKSSDPSLSTAEILAKILDHTGELYRMSDEQIKQIQSKLHQLDPETKSQIMKILGPRLKNKSGEMAGALGMSAAEFNDMWHVDENELDESPDYVGGIQQLNKQDDREYLNWWNGQNCAFFAFKKFSFIGEKKTHFEVFTAVRKTRENGERSLLWFRDQGVMFFGDQEAFYKDLYEEGGILYGYFAAKITPRYHDDYPGMILGRAWVDRNIISFWDTQKFVISHWDHVVEMFHDARFLGDLDKYNIDWIERGCDKPFSTAEKVSSSIKSVSPTRENYVERVIEMLEKTCLLDVLTDEQIKKIREVIHILDPQVKAEIMKDMGETLSNKSSEIADKLHMSVAEFNSLWHMDESKLDESPDTIAPDKYVKASDKAEKHGIKIGHTTSDWRDNDAVPFIIDRQNKMTMISPDLCSAHGKLVHPEMGAQIVAYNHDPNIFNKFKASKYPGWGFDLMKGQELYGDESGKEVVTGAIIVLQAKSIIELCKYLKKVHYEIPLHGDIPRDDKNFILGRVWTDSKTISFWEKRKEVLEYFNIVEELLLALKLDKAHMLYDFIDEDELLTYDELTTKKFSSKDQEEIKRLMAIQHLDPEAKKKLNMMLGNIQQKGNDGFDFQAQRDAEMPALQEIVRAINKDPKDKAINLFWKLAPDESHWSMDISSGAVHRSDAIQLYSFHVDKEFRGKGLGERILTILCKAADRFCVPIELEPGGKDSEAYRLVPWYERHGFKWKSGFMRREPNTSM
jgi:GNAT superfamily N-acetyltransferase